MNEIELVRTAAPKSKTGLPSQEQHLSAERAIVNHLSRVKATHFPIMRAAWNDSEPERQLVQHNANLGELRKALERSAHPQDIRKVEDVLRGALRAAPDAKVTMTAVALLMDAQVRGPHNPEAFMNIATMDVMDEGYGPQIVTAACRRLRRSQTFTASVAEILATCRAVRDEYVAALKTCAEAMREYDKIQQCIESSAKAIEDLQSKEGEE